MKVIPKDFQTWVKNSTGMKHRIRCIKHDLISLCLSGDVDSEIRMKITIDQLYSDFTFKKPDSSCRADGYYWVKWDECDWQVKEYSANLGWFVGPYISLSEYCNDDEFDEIDEKRIFRG